MARPKISVIIIVKNEQDMIEDCLKSAGWADEIILLEGGSTDNTLKIAEKFKVKICRQKEKSLDFAAWHNQGKEESSGEWIFYLDADERTTPELKKEILTVVPGTGFSAFAVPRRNFLLGKELKHGGWYPDYQTRLFKKEKLKKWIGKLHEHPEIEGPTARLKFPLIHLQPATIEPALGKTIRWSKIEAELLHKANHPPVTWWRILRMGLTTLFNRLIKKQGFRDGNEGWIESIYQSFHTMTVYIRLWEMQRESNSNVSDEENQK